MQALFASKTFKGLSNESKAHVRAAITNPINIGLVTQLRSYLDDEYQEIFAPKGEPQEIEVADVEEEEVDKGTETPESSHTSGSHSAPNISVTPKKSFGEKVEDVEEKLGDMPEDDHIEVETEKEEVKESINVTQSSINASVGISALTDMVNEIKDSLNLDATTCGVVRVNIKDKELWIYYSDNINLNNVMNDVIDKLNAGGYVDLGFSRLARTDNAIVFDINLIDTDNVVEPIEDKDEK